MMSRAWPVLLLCLLLGCPTDTGDDDVWVAGLAGEGDTDLLNFDLFTKADGPIDRVRGEFGIPPKSARVLALDPIGAASPG